MLWQLEHADGVVADIYAAASPAFDAEDIEWACEVESPPAYLGSQPLAMIYRMACGATGGLRNTAEYPLVLAYGAMPALAALDSASLPAAMAGLQGAAVGFDDGDFLWLGSFAGGRFTADVRAG